MKFPNKVTSYKESILPKFGIVLIELSKRDMRPIDLYYETRKHFSSVIEFFDTLDCLFALNIIALSNGEETIHYVI